MSAPNPKRQREAYKTLDAIMASATHVWVIHYSCESFYDRPEGRSPRVTSVALRNLSSGQTVSFSIHQVAERKGVKVSDIPARYDEFEKAMLAGLFDFLKSHKADRFLHWNMRDSNFGFAAIEHRYRVLKGEPFVVDDDKKVDLARLLIAIYGTGYTGHPRLETLIQKNNIAPLDFLSGADEAAAFDAQNYVALHQSTLRKVDVMANIAGRAFDRDLKTNTTWWEMHGGHVRTAVNWIAENKTFQLIAGIASIIGLGIAIVTLWPSPTSTPPTEIARDAG